MTVESITAGAAWLAALTALAHAHGHPDPVGLAVQADSTFARSSSATYMRQVNDWMAEQTAIHHSHTRWPFPPLHRPSPSPRYATVKHEWDHPHRGRITELLCAEHDAELLNALRLLGIGSSGTDSPPANACNRCLNPQYPPHPLATDSDVITATTDPHLFTYGGTSCSPSTSAPAAPPPASPSTSPSK